MEKNMKYVTKYGLSEDHKQCGAEVMGCLKTINSAVLK